MQTLVGILRLVPGQGTGREGLSLSLALLPKPEKSPVYRLTVVL